MAGTSIDYADVQGTILRGYRVDLGDLTVEVTDLTADGRPAQVAVRFRSPLDDPSLRFVRWQGAGYRDWTPPAVGETADLPEMGFLN